MEWNDEQHNMSTSEVDAFLENIDNLIETVQENQWMKYDDSCMSVRYSLLIKMLYDLTLGEGWTTEQLRDDIEYHLNQVNTILEKRSKDIINPKQTEEQFLKELNEINKTESFKKSLFISLGADLAQNATQLIAGFTFRNSFSLLGKNGKVIGDVAGAYTNNLTNEMSDLAKKATNYVLYRFSREQLYKKAQLVNENIYSLLGK